AVLDHAIALDVIALDTEQGPRLSANWRCASALVSTAEITRLADTWMVMLEAMVRHAAQPDAGGRTTGDVPLVLVDQDELERLEQQFADVQDLWPLTPLHEGLLFHARYRSEGLDPYLVQLVSDLDGPLDVDRLRTALDNL